MSKVLHNFIAGFFMGIAEITPGISGATIAGLFNVYKDFLGSLTAFSPKLKDISLKKFLQDLNINFLIPLFSGMGIAIYLASFLIDYLITNHLFSFKIFLSSVMFVAVVKNTFIDHRWGITQRYWVNFLVGIALAAIVSMSLISFNFQDYLMLVFAGFFAFSAFLLPGISGSLVLVMLGVYPLVIESVKTLDLIAIAPLLFGFLLSFLFLPKQIVKRFIDNEERVKMLFSGLIAGSVPAVWLHLN